MCRISIVGINYWSFGAKAGMTTAGFMRGLVQEIDPSGLMQQMLYPNSQREEAQREFGKFDSGLEILNLLSEP